MDEQDPTPTVLRRDAREVTLKLFRSATLVFVCGSIAGATVVATAVPASPQRSAVVELATTAPLLHAEQAALTTQNRFSVLDAYLFPGNEPQTGLAGRRTDGIVIVQDGRIVHERYARGFGPERKHFTWSVSKTVMGALVGIAIAQGKLGLDDSICKHGLSTYHCSLTVRHLLHWSSCLEWNEEYEGAETPANSSVLQMLYNRGSSDMARYVARHDAACAPGSAMRYSSGDSNLLSGVLKRALGRDYKDFPWKALFDRIGMNTATWEPDRSGTYIGSSSLFASPRDLAKFGLLMLNDGVWNGQQILPKGWVAFATEIAPAQRLRRFNPNDPDVAGAHLWLNKPLPEANLGRPWPEAPGDAYAALGHWGQSVTVIPSLRAVLVRTGDTRDDSFNYREYLRLATRALEGKQ